MLRKYLNHFSVDIMLETLEPLLVKSGTTSIGGADMAFVRTRRNGHAQPFIPGTSLKGVLRSHAERIARTLKEGSVCDVFETSLPGRRQGCSWTLREESKKGKYKIEAPAIYGQQCPACRLFGSLRWKGRFSVGDAYLTEPFAEVEPELRDGIGIDRLTGGVSGSAKFDLEVLPSGVRFRTHLEIRNFELGQLAWVGFVLRDLQEGMIRVGFGTSRGLGRVRATLENLTLRYTGDPEALKEHVVGIGDLLSAEEARAYGVQHPDRAEKPQGLTFTRSPGSLYTEACVGSEQVSALFEALIPAWKSYLELT